MTSTTWLTDDPLPRPRRIRPDVDIVIPVHNEAASLERSLLRLYAFLNASFPFSFVVTIVDNASSDETWPIAQRLAGSLARVRARHLDRKGRGRALRDAWTHSDAEVLVYMDVDLATDLRALLPLVAPLLSGHSDVATGTRLRRSSRVVRGPRRELISRGYNLLLRGVLGTTFTDAQCGFKAIRSDVAEQMLPMIDDEDWFFDTELLVLAERAGLRIHEVPVDWVDDPDSRVQVVRTAVDDLKGMWRIGSRLASGRIALADLRPGDGRRRLTPSLTTQVVRFGAIGVVSTLAYVLLFLVLRTGLSAQVANAAALLMTAVGNTVANRRLTFGISGRMGRLRHLGQGLAVFVVAWGLTAGALQLLHAAAPAAGRGIEVGVALAASVVATLARFVLLRRWVFAADEPGSGTVPGDLGLAVAEPASVAA
jgi:glycosyltransferase involved in cell wall biosynthesis/putative flippase GtrA